MRATGGFLNRREVLRLTGQRRRAALNLCVSARNERPIVSIAAASITTVLRIVCLLEICLLRAAKVSRLRFTMTVATRPLSITML
jgi:hypothetical protein